MAAPTAGEERLDVVVRGKQLIGRVLGLQGHAGQGNSLQHYCKEFVVTGPRCRSRTALATDSSSASQSAGSESGMATNLEVPTPMNCSILVRKPSWPEAITAVGSARSGRRAAIAA